MDAAPTTSRAAVAPAAARRLAADYLALTKPKVQSLLLLTTITTMYVAGDPSLGLVALTVLGGSLSAGAEPTPAPTPAEAQRVTGGA